MAIIAPSILAADFSKLGEEVDSAISTGVETLHLDIMDGHFVSNISFGADISKAVIKRAAPLKLDAHLMVTMPEHYIDSFAKAGADLFTFHLEIDARRQALPGGNWVYGATELRYTSRINHIIDKVRAAGMKVGLALNPPTDPKLAAPFLDKVDRLLLMSVNPGFGGQSFIEETFSKLERTAKYRQKKKLKFDIQIDGGVGVDNIGKLVSLGADNLVCGTSFFGADDYSARLQELTAALSVSSK